MLVVTRRKGQRIVIGSDIEIVVSEISGSTVRLAILAPRSVSVLRGEMLDEVRKRNQEAADMPLEITLHGWNRIGLKSIELQVENGVAPVSDLRPQRCGNLIPFLLEFLHHPVEGRSMFGQGLVFLTAHHPA